jgi:hypothetical protein
VDSGYCNSGFAISGPAKEQRKKKDDDREFFIVLSSKDKGKSS